jgi:hypothetical protein
MRAGMTMEKLLQWVDQLIEMGDAVLRTRHQESDSRGEDDIDPLWRDSTRHQVSGPEWVDGGKMAEFRAASLSFMQNVYGEKHPYFQEFFKTADAPYPEHVERGLGILRAIRREIACGRLFTFRGLVMAEVFTDYMQMAEYLLELSANGKDPAAVIAGSTLEAHLRQLCMKNGISVAQPKNGKSVPLKADTLNNELTGAGVYNMADQKQVTAWLDLRNKAAHGDYTAYTKDQIKLMVSGVISFIARNAV